VEKLLREAAEAFDLLIQEGEIPLQGLQEVRPLLLRARAEGTCLLPEDLLRIKATLGAAGEAREFLGRAGEAYPLLQAWAEQIADFRELYEVLDSSLGPRGEILDSASPELRRIRKEISLARARIRRALEALWGKEELRNIFQEQIITLRNERYVVAVKAEFKNILPGIIHDQSQSRATFFIEPLSTVEENNELNLLLQDEKEEERRILLSLTALVRERTDEIGRAVEVLGYLDLTFAKARWARTFGATIPSLNDRGSWDLRRARHPLLGPKAVPIDFRLGQGQSTLIITGANTGGKTVALKTLGLLNLMAQSGVPIPAAEGSEVAVFGKIFADIGDEQSLQENLSTFSAWVRTLSQILREADPRSLVLLDEVGGGTDPTEGAALTMALLDGLRSRGVKTVVTTHLHLLKAYAAVHPDAVNVSVEFDPETLRPTYRLIYGQPGESHALLMAEKWGLPHELVERAHSYLGQGERRVGQLLQSLEETRREMEKKLKEAEEIKREAEALRREAELLLDRTRKEEEKRLSQTREEAQEMIRQAWEELRRLINEFKAKGRTDVHRLGQEIREREESLRDWALHKEREAWPSEGRAAVIQNQDSPPATLAQLKEVWALKSGKKGKTQDQAGVIDYPVPSVSRKMKVIGLRVEEALPLLDRTIDQAFLAGLNTLEIIHGAGTGRLRKAIREYLSQHALVKAFLPGGPGRGGDGVTVVEIGPAPGAKGGQRRPSKAGTERG